MHIVKDGVLSEDQWVHLDAATALSDEEWKQGSITIPFSRWLAERGAFVDLAKAGRLGLRMRPDDDISQLTQADMQPVALCVLEITPFADGRSFSQARVLRGRLAYRGELRADGAFLTDQVFFLSRVGVNSYTLNEQRTADSIVVALESFSVRYQAAVDEPLPLYRRRQR